MAAKSRARIKWHEPKRLGLSRLNHLPNIYTELVAHTGHLIHKCDVDTPESIFEELYHLCRFRRGNWNNPFDELLIQQRSQLGAARRHTTHHFWNIPRCIACISGIHSLGGKRKEEVPACFQTCSLQDG